MSNEQRADLINRDTILKMLTNAEVSRVSTAETAAKLAGGEEYIDLEQLAKGVQCVGGTNAVDMGHVLPRNAVAPETWARIIAQLKG